jgi:hypothetical protein
MNFIYFVLLLMAAASERLDLAGRVTATDGVSVKGARVMIYTARMRKGTNALCPSCYADCSKKAETGQDGSFKIAALDPDLLFRVLVVADGFRPAFAENVDPGAKPITVVLAPLNPGKLDANRLLKGIVLGPDGCAAAGRHRHAPRVQDGGVVGVQTGCLRPAGRDESPGRVRADRAVAHRRGRAQGGSERACAADLCRPSAAT